MNAKELAGIWLVFNAYQMDQLFEPRAAECITAARKQINRDTEQRAKESGFDTPREWVDYVMEGCGPKT